MTLQDEDVETLRSVYPDVCSPEPKTSFLCGMILLLVFGIRETSSVRSLSTPYLKLMTTIRRMTSGLSRRLRMS